LGKGQLTELKAISDKACIEPGWVSPNCPFLTNEATLSAAQSALFGDLQKNWGWLLALGILSLVLGTLGFYMTFGLTLASVLFFGVLLVVGGLGQLVHAFTCQGWNRWQPSAGLSGRFQWNTHADDGAKNKSTSADAAKPAPDSGATG